MRQFWMTVALLPAMIVGAQAQTKSPPTTSPPAIVQAEIDRAKQECSSGAAIKDGFMSRNDILGKDRPIYILDYGAFSCGDDTSYFCGTAGCLTQVFAPGKNGSDVKIVEENVQGITIKQIRAKVAIVLELHGGACNKSGSEPCRKTLYWNGTSFASAR